MACETEKKAAAMLAAKSIKEGMRIGLGTGSTVYFFVERLRELCQQGLQIAAVCSSVATQELAESAQIPLLHTWNRLDLTVDGADEIDTEGQMIKGGGGALLREKIIAQASDQLIIIADQSKCVKRLGSVKLPIEILPFGHLATIKMIGYKGRMRDRTTDNGNLIYDIHFKEEEDLHALQARLHAIAGVVETGLFLDFKPRVIVGGHEIHSTEA